MTMGIDGRLEEIGSGRRTLKSRVTRILAFLAVIAVSSTVAAEVGKISSRHTVVAVENALRLNGQSVMSEQQLVTLVASNHLQVYWAGPEKDARYFLNASDATKIVLTIVPSLQAGRTTRSRYPQITTYIQKNAFLSVLYGGGNLNVNGFINADGHAVFYSHLDPNDAYVGLRGKDVEIQVYDPRQGNSLEIATEVGRLIPIVLAKS